MTEPNSRSAPPAGPRALLRLVEVFAFLSDRKAGATLTEIGSALEVPVSSLLAILRLLVQEQYLVRSGTAYRIGPGAQALALRILGESHLGTLALGLMRKLSREVGETVVLARPDDNGDRVIYTDVVECERAVRYAVQVGDTRPYYASAAGRVVLAYKDAGWIERYLDRTPLTRITPRTLHQRSRLMVTLEEVRRTGVSESVEEYTDGGAGIAAPLFGHGGELTGVLTIGAVATRARQEGERYSAAVKAYAADLSALLAVRSAR